MQNKDDSSKHISTNFLYNFIRMIGGKAIALNEVTLQSHGFYCLGFNSDRAKIVQSVFPQAKIFNQKPHCLVLLSLEETQKIFFDFFNKGLKKFADSMAWGKVEASTYPCLIDKAKFDLIKNSMKNAKDLLNLGLAIGSYVETPPVSSFTMYGGLVPNGGYETKYYICIENWEKFFEVNVLEAVLAEVAQQARFETLKKVAYCKRPESTLSFIKTLDQSAQRHFLSFFSEYANSPEDINIGLSILSKARDKNNNNNSKVSTIDLYPHDSQFLKEIKQKKETLKKKRSTFFSLHPKRKEHKELFLDLFLIFKETQPNFSFQKHLEIISKEDPQFYQLACEGNSSETKILLDDIANHTYSSPSK